MNSIETFIKTIREADQLNEMIYMQGGCYKFHKILKCVYPNAKPVGVGQSVSHATECGHIVTLINGEHYDIKGKVDMTKEYIRTIPKDVDTWNFSLNNCFYQECPECENEVYFDYFTDKNIFRLYKSFYEYVEGVLINTGEYDEILTLYKVITHQLKEVVTDGN